VTTTAPVRWLKRLDDLSRPVRSRLVCFPHAGGAAGAYQGWVRHLPPETELLAVQYPGRQERINEPTAASMDEMADTVSAALAALPPLRTAVFGHSMGALVAYETSVRLQARAPWAAPARVFVSAAAAPAPEGRAGLPALDDDSLVAYARRQGGADPEVYDIPELRELLLLSLRADFALLTAYRPAAQPRRLTAPLTALGGDEDRSCPPVSLATWAPYTTGPFTTRVFTGGHFYLQGREDTLTRLVTA
jgi:pyochelin biosynthetic protein PchC